VSEPGSNIVRRLLFSATFATSRLSEVEICSAVARRCREGGLSAERRDQIFSALRLDMQSLYVVELSSAIAVICQQLLVRRTLRAGDAIQLASCLHLHEEVGQPVEFVAFDQRLAAAAEAEGLKIAV
jgi:predicted nucleic acid-binding protein